MRKIVFVALGFFSLGTANGASFDCRKASTQIEKLICANAELSKLDEDLNAAYKTNLEVEGRVLSVESIKLAQQQWIRKRNSCYNTECLIDVYKARIARLSAINRAEEVQNSTAIKSNNAVCQKIAEYATNGALSTLLAPESELAPDFGDLNAVFGPEANFSGTGGYWTADLNGDGLPDHLSIVSDGTMNDETAYVISGKKGATFKTINDDAEGNLTLSLVKVGRKYFLLSNSGPIPRSLGKSIPGKLWRVGSAGDFELVCTFSHRQSELIVGKQNPICSDASAGRLNYIRTHLTTPLVPLTRRPDH